MTRGSSRRYRGGHLLADFCVAATLSHAEEIGLPLEDYAHIRRFSDELMELEAWRDPWPS